MSIRFWATAAMVMLYLSRGVSADAATLTTLHAFCAKADCSDGKLPYGGVIIAPSGALYGTTNAGGKHGGGVVFQLVRNGTAWKYRVIHSFCAKTSCIDGGGPYGLLVLDGAGNLYGTAHDGGRWGGGTAYRLSPTANPAKWTYTALHHFCALDFCTDGDAPAIGLTYEGASSGVLYDGASPLYGVAVRGGAHDFGTVFQLKPKPGSKGWTHKVLLSFNGSDGGYPQGALAMDTGGNLYEDTGQGGTHFAGTLIRLAPNAARTKWTETILHDFCSSEACADGSQPFAGLLVDSSGALYGTTSHGGISGGGTAFKLVPQGQNPPLVVLSSFCTLPSCADGAAPGSLMQGPACSLFGTTLGGGDNAAGTVFMLDQSRRTLYDFCSNPECADGNTPTVEIAADASGTLYGATTNAGPHDGGTVFALVP